MEPPKAASAPFDIVHAARKVAAAQGFRTEIPAELVAEAEAMRDQPLPEPGPSLVDLRELPFSSIDNEESRDLDQIEHAERLPSGEIRLRVAIADVDAYVPKGSPLDLQAAHNTATLYTGSVVFGMLPEVLSTDLTSLNPGVERVAVVLDMKVSKDGSVVAEDAYRALVVNHAKLEYDSVGEWLERTAPLPHAAKGFQAQLALQDEAARALMAKRYERGALDSETLEARAVAVDGKVVDLTLLKKTRARSLIEDFMIATNGAMARFLDARKRSQVRRVVKKPERWQRIVDLARSFGETLPDAASALALSGFLERRKKAEPARFADLSLAVVKLMGPGEYALDRGAHDREGHFGLAVSDYTHATAPNRRYADLVSQRILKAALSGAPAPYSDEELATVASRCTERENAARKVERTMRKIAASLMLSTRLGEEFDAIVTGVTETGTFVRLLAPPAEGRVVQGEQGLDVGDALRVKLVATEPSRGFVDFVRVHAPHAR